MTGSWARVLETHTAALFFAGDRIYKVKKPVRLDFLDLTGLAARRVDCEREVALNRRLAPDVYLGVASIGLPGESAEPAVVMRRLPERSSLAARIDARERRLDRAVEAVADRLASFHAECLVVGRELPTDAWTPPAELWQAEVERLRRMGGADLEPGRLDRVGALAEAYVGGRASLLAERLASGLVRDGHGDLLASDIYLLPDGPRVLDCLEFDDRLRVCDVLHDVAFLAMDLEHRGRPDLARTLLERYAAAAGETHPATLAHFFVAHRALIRAKVHAIRARQTHEADPQIRQLLDLCRRHLDRAQVRVVLVGGLPGAGKSTLAARLGAELPATVLSSDRIRSELVAGNEPIPRFDTGRYAPAVSRRVYRELLQRARVAVEHGDHVVLDASWRSATERSAARWMATQAGAIVVEILAEVPDEVAAARLAARPRVPGGSEATDAVRREMRARFDRWPEASVVHTASGEREKGAVS